MCGLKRFAFGNLRVKGGTAVVKGIQDAGGQAEFIKHNVSSEADWANVAATVKAKAANWMCWSTMPVS